MSPSASELFVLVANVKLKDDDVRKERLKMEQQLKRTTQLRPPNGVSHVQTAASSLPKTRRHSECRLVCVFCEHALYVVTPDTITSGQKPVHTSTLFSMRVQRKKKPLGLHWLPHCLNETSKHLVRVPRGILAWADQGRRRLDQKR